MRTWIEMLPGVALLAVAGCSDGLEPMSGRTSEVRACVDVLVQDTADHYDAIIGEDDLPAIDMLEEHFYGHSVADLSDLDYWVGETGECRDLMGHGVDLGNLDDHQVEAARQVALHRLVMAFVDDVTAARAEEQRYQLAMMAQLGELRGHQLVLESEAGDYLCP